MLGGVEGFNIRGRGLLVIFFRIFKRGTKRSYSEGWDCENHL